jgi:DivIVA domain-containing protein
MVDLASIRNASFSLTPTGYNPEEVDQFLADLADQLSEMPQAPQAPEPVVTQIPIEQPVELPQIEATERPTADLDGLQGAVERTITAMDEFVRTELAEVKAASALEIEEIHRQRERMLADAGDAAQARIDEARSQSEQIVEGARGEGDEIRRQVELELQAERERFEQALADRDAQAQARVAEVLAEAEDRKREAEQLVADANKVQSQVLGAIESARASLALPPVAVETFQVETVETVEAEVSSTIEEEPEAVNDEPETTSETDSEPDVDVFGFERDSSQGSSLRSMISDVRGESDSDDSESNDELDDAADAAA